jgi:hypothetical protein
LAKLKQACRAADFDCFEVKEIDVRFHEARVRIIKTMEVVVANLRPLLGSESITDVQQLVKIISLFVSYQTLPGVEDLSKKMFALIFNNSDKVQATVMDSF